MILVAAGCQPAAVFPALSSTATTPLVATATRVKDTPAPPSSTPTTIIPTATTPPAPLTPTPKKDLTLSDIVGNWTRSDTQRGDLFITLTEEGRYVASHGTPEGGVHRGAFSLEDGLLIFLDGWDCFPLPENTPGGYQLDLRNEGKWLYFKLDDDACIDRAEALGTYRWSRYVRTP